MFIKIAGHYLPKEIVPNDYFLNVNGLTDDWIVARTGINTRRKAAANENANTMAVDAVKAIVEMQPGILNDIDLIIGASYAPYDTVATIAHHVQREFDIRNAMAVYLSTACSSFINALEIVEGYFATGKASKALIVNSEHNTLYGHEEDDKSGHLWGDGASAIIVGKNRESSGDIEIVDIKSRGLGFEGRGTEGVWLRPKHEGLVMPYGKDVFVHACNYMREAAVEILDKNGIGLEGIDYFIPHQANIRIINHVAEKLKLSTDKVIVNIDRLGNTGSASTVIGISENFNRFKTGDIIVISVFGGGYSSGAALLKK